MVKARRLPSARLVSDLVLAPVLAPVLELLSALILTLIVDMPRQLDLQLGIEGAVPDHAAELGHRGAAAVIDLAEAVPGRELDMRRHGRPRRLCGPPAEEFELAGETIERHLDEAGRLVAERVRQALALERDRTGAGEGLQQAGIR